MVRPFLVSLLPARASRKEESFCFTLHQSFASPDLTSVPATSLANPNQPQNNQKVRPGRATPPGPLSTRLPRRLLPSSRDSILLLSDGSPRHRPGRRRHRKEPAQAHGVLQVMKFRRPEDGPKREYACVAIYIPGTTATRCPPSTAPRPPPSTRCSR